MTSSISVPSPVIPNVVCDIDEFLVCPNAGSYETAAYFQEKGGIIPVYLKEYNRKITHYVLPGVLEYINTLLKAHVNKEIKFSVFSAAKRLRQDELLPKLFKLALQIDNYKPEEADEIISSVRVFSREDLTAIKDSEMHLHDLWDHFHHKKDLTKVLEKGDKIEDAVLFDNERHNYHPTQEKNFVYIPTTTYENFVNVLDKCMHYRSDGIRLLKCFLIDKTLAGQEQIINCEKSARKGQKILISKKGFAWEIRFLDHSGNYLQKLITPQQQPKLAAAIKEQFKKYQDENKFCENILDLSLVEDICKFVDSYKGRTTKICRQVNRIFYATGLLFEGLKEAKNRNVSLSSVLYEWQHEWKATTTPPEFSEEGKILEPTLLMVNVFTNSIKNDDFYKKGLEILQKVNPKMTFTTPHQFSEYCELNHFSKMDKEQILTLREAIKWEYKEKR